MYKLKPLEWQDAERGSTALFFGITFTVNINLHGKWNVSMVVHGKRPENEHNLNSREQAKVWAEKKLLPMQVTKYLEEVDTQAERFKVLKVPYTQVVLVKPIRNMGVKLGTWFDVKHKETYSYIVIEGGEMILNQVALDYFAPADIRPIDVEHCCGTEEKALRELAIAQKNFMEHFFGAEIDKACTMSGQIDIMGQLAHKAGIV